MNISTNSNTLFAEGAASGEDGTTHIRLRGELLLALTSVGSVLDGFPEVAAGVCIVTDNAFGVGITAIPDPIVDQAWDGWLWYWTGAIIATNATLGRGSVSAEVRLSIDSKAMRKFKATDVMCGVISTADEVGVAGMQATLNTRALDKLS